MTLQVDEIGTLTPGDHPPLSTMDEVLQAYEKGRVKQPELLQEEIKKQLAIFDSNKVFSELKSIKPEVVDKEVGAASKWQPRPAVLRHAPTSKWHLLPAVLACALRATRAALRPLGHEP